MFSKYQLNKAKKLKIRKNKDGYIVNGDSGKYKVSFKDNKPSCDCWHFVNKTVHDIENGKSFLDIWFCSHILAVLYKEDFKGFKKMVDKLTGVTDES